jgi:peptidoglycan/xylan/chitin deacetylase (PgdA/CDA1 family)
LIGALASAAVAAGAGTLTAGAFLPNARLFGPVIGRGSRSRRIAFLTFDDGPSPRATPAILDTLAAAGAPATFFMVGRHALSHPGLARAVAEGGHLVGSHTMTHRKLTLLGPREVAAEIREGHRSVTGASGVEPGAFRAPHGHRNPFVDRTLRAMGCPLVGWTLGVWDSDRPGAEEIRRRARAGMKPGTILLLHDGDGYDPNGDRSQTADALPGILADLRDAGYEIRPLVELLP